jgi:hypothetical protein
LLPIKLTLAGGLGNQLFQLSAGIYLEKKIGRNVIYDISNLMVKPNAEIGNYTRRLEIEELILDNQTINSRYPFRADYAVRFLRRIINPDSVIIEGGPNCDALERVNGQTTAVYGYFQRAKIVNDAWPILISKLEQSPKFASLVNSKKIHRIAIHLRFGDYSDDPRTKSAHGLTSSKYFEQALESIRLNEMRDVPILVVTDDQNKAAGFISSFIGLTNFQIISNSDPIDDLIELSRSSHVVITNSTFSWWGGWIADKVHKSGVIYPRPWFADETDPELPIYVSNWTGLEREFTAT